MKAKTKTATHKEIIKARLLAGARLTVWECINTNGIATLPQRVFDLRASGFAVISAKIPNCKHYEYWLDETTIKSYRSEGTR